MLKSIDNSKKEISSAYNYIQRIISSMVDTLIAVDNNGLIERVNSAAVDMLGFREAEMIGRPVEMLLKVIKWFFIEQDIRYWNYSGRNMLKNGIDAL